MRYGGVMGNEIFWKIEIKLWGKGSIKGIMAIRKLCTNISGFLFWHYLVIHDIPDYEYTNFVFHFLGRVMEILIAS